MTNVSQVNKTIARKITAKNKILLPTGSLIKKYRQPIIKLWSVPVPVCETVPKFLLTDFTESYIDKGMLKEKAVLLFK